MRDVLVIGAGDGGVIRELTRYPEIEHIDLVEIDELVVEVCRKYLPKTACRLDDPRVSIHYEDGVRFVRSCEDKYDLIIVDSTDPFGPGEGLFTREFYGSCFKALHEDGLWSTSTRAPFTRRTPLPASAPTSGLWSHSPSAACTRRTFPLTPPATGCSALLPESTILKGFKGGCLEFKRPVLPLLYDDPAQRSLLPSGLCRASAGRGGIVFSKQADIQENIQ